MELLLLAKLVSEVIESGEGMRYLNGILAVVGIVESVVKVLKGSDKQTVAMNLLDVLIPSLNDVVGKEVLSLPEAQAATKSFIDAAVNLKNVIFKLSGKEIF